MSKLHYFHFILKSTRGKLYHSDDCLDYAKVQEIQELYPQIGFSIGKTLSGLLTK